MNRSILVPFTGFDSGDWEFMLDHTFEWEAGFLAGKDEENADLDPSQHLDEADYKDILLEAYAPRRALPAMAREYVRRYSANVSAQLKTNLALSYSTFRPARGYHPDRIFATITLGSVEALFRASAGQGHCRLRDEIEETCGSGEDYVSFKSAKLEDWLAKPIRRWNHYELGTLLASVADPDLERRIANHMTDESDVLECIYVGFSYKVFDRGVRRLRRENAKENAEAAHNQ